MANNKNVIIKDIFWYLIGNIAPLIVGLIKSPIYTRIFSTEDYGAYSLVFLIFSYLSIICYSWIVSCAWRFYYQYKQKNSLDILYSNLTFLYLLFSFVIFIFSCVWIGTSGNMLVKKLIFWCFLQFFTSEISGLFFIRPRLEGKTFYYNMIQTVRAIGNFGLLLLLTFVFDFGIEAFLISNIVFNVIIIAFIVIPDYFRMKLSPRLIYKKELIVLYKYGQIGIVINICTTLLVSSDRFIIQYFTGLSEVGIYNQNYNVAQISIAMLIQVFWATLNPYLLPVMEFRPPNMKQQIYEFFKMYCHCFTPITLYFVLYAQNIAEIMLGEDFRIGYSVILWTAVGEFVSGLCFLNISNLKFKNELKILSGAFILALTVNIILNVILIPLLGYQIAAITTVAANLLLLLIFRYKNPEIECYSVLFKSRNFKYCILLLSVQTGIHFLSRHYSLPNTYYIIEGVLFCIIYAFIAIKNKWINLNKIQLLHETCMN
ncbi:MAG: oligosaccharide flippase family protein [Candidatus Azobacteroides sp.]|nr:oligosaccharide flippase family protein [Candidatus Azobacteroides sp.]